MVKEGGREDGGGEEGILADLCEPVRPVSVHRPVSLSQLGWCGALSTNLCAVFTLF